jgi:hypothetical protein
MQVMIPDRAILAQFDSLSILFIEGKLVSGTLFRARKMVPDTNVTMNLIPCARFCRGRDAFPCIKAVAPL